MVGNVGLYHICCELSKRGWNVLPTSRNAKGVDIIIYNQNATRTLTIQVKSLSKRNAVPLGGKLDNLVADYIIICRNVIDKNKNPEVFIAKTDKAKNEVSRHGKYENAAYWWPPPKYEVYKDKWDKIGEGNI